MNELIGPTQMLIMSAIWDKGPMTVHEIHQGLNGPNPHGHPDHRAYTTVLTIMRNLNKRGFLATSKGGRSFIFSATVPRDEYMRSAVRWFVDSHFNGDKAALFQLLKIL